MDNTNKKTYQYSPVDNEKSRWCKKHPALFWGKDQFNNWYPKCVQGNRTQEECEIGE